mgnify:FL=1
MRATLMMAGLAVLLALQACAQERPEWVSRIRSDHPRVFLNEDQWPAVRARAEGTMAEHYARLKAQADGLPEELEVKDYGDIVMNVAFV